MFLEKIDQFADLCNVFEKIDQFADIPFKISIFLIVTGRVFETAGLE